MCVYLLSLHYLGRAHTRALRSSGRSTAYLNQRPEEVSRVVRAMAHNLQRLAVRFCRDHAFECWPWRRGVLVTALVRTAHLSLYI